MPRSSKNTGDAIANYIEYLEINYHKCSEFESEDLAEVLKRRKNKKRITHEFCEKQTKIFIKKGGIIVKLPPQENLSASISGVMYSTYETIFYEPRVIRKGFRVHRV